jgi:hypothetical protein
VAEEVWTSLMVYRYENRYPGCVSHACLLTETAFPCKGSLRDCFHKSLAVEALRGF